MIEVEQFYLSEFIKTASMNYISRRARLEGAQNIDCFGKCIIKHNVVIRGDLAHISIGTYCYIDNKTIIRPSYMITAAKGFHFLPITIGRNVKIGENCVIECCSIGDNVTIGNNVILGKRSLVRENCVINDGTMLTEGSVMPPRSMLRRYPCDNGSDDVYPGPSELVEDGVSEGTYIYAASCSRLRYQRFVPFEPRLEVK